MTKTELLVGLVTSMILGIVVILALTSLPFGLFVLQCMGSWWLGSKVGIVVANLAHRWAH